MKKTILFLVLIFCLTIYGGGSYLTHAHQVDIGEIPINLKDVEEVSFLSTSNAEISAWFFSSFEKKGGVLLLHGVKSNRLQMLDRAKFLQKAGYSVLLIDFQAHGKSLGEKITFGYLEALDAESAYMYLEKRIHSRNIAVIGVSLGGAAALVGNVKNKAKIMILESVYPTLEEAIIDRLEIYLGSIGAYLSPLLTLQLKPRLGFGVDALRPIDHITKRKGAVVIIAGEKDRHTKLIESQRLYSKASDPKELWIVENAKHQDFHKLLGKSYELKILGYLQIWI